MKTKSLMVISRVPKSGMRITLMGIISMLKQEVQDIALLKPVVSDKKEYGEDIDFFTNYFKLTQNPKKSYGISINRIKKEVARDNIEYIYETLLEQYEELLNSYNFVLCEGVQSLELEEFLDFDINFEIAKNLQIPIVEIINGYREEFEIIEENIRYIIHQSQKEGVSLLGIFINRVSLEIMLRLKNIKLEVPLFLLPEIEELNKPTLLDIIKQTNAKLFTTDRGVLQRVVKQTKIATMMLDNYLNYLEDGDLIIVSGDRSDIIVGTFVANLSNHYPTITGTVQAGALFTEEYLPAQTIMYSLAIANNTFSKKIGNFKTANNVMEFFNSISKYIQIGGNSTLGKGIVEINCEGCKNESKGC